MKNSTRVQAVFATVAFSLGLALGACGAGPEILSPEAPNPAPIESVEGTVKTVEKKPNVAEDGRYRLEIETEDGLVLLAADAYLNTPVTPESEGMACVELPEELEEGVRVNYSLPNAREDFTEAVNADGRYVGVVSTCGPEENVGDWYLYATVPVA